jgi:hypothetical protein
LPKPREKLLRWKSLELFISHQRYETTLHNYQCAKES